ncbi:MAG: hypothetical protein J6M59_10685 [Bacteroidaceae bacterium]|nr:hypothetical protein [Bacteroidaceae bacterium]
MITSTDFANIVYLKAKKLGIAEVYQDSVTDISEIKTPRVVVHPKMLSGNGRIWCEGYVEVNICIPDKNGKAQLQSLNRYERTAKELFTMFGTYDSTPYRIKVESFQVIGDKSLNYHFANVRLSTEVLNIKQ